MTYYTSTERARMAAALARSDADARRVRNRERIAAVLFCLLSAGAILSVFYGVTR